MQGKGILLTESRREKPESVIHRSSETSRSDVTNVDQERENEP